MPNEDEFKAGLGKALGQQQTTLESYRLEDAIKNGWINDISPVRLSQPNNYKGCIVTGPEGRGFLLLGKASAANIAVGTIPAKDWVVVKTINANGEERFKISENSQLIGLEGLR